MNIRSSNPLPQICVSTLIWHDDPFEKVVREIARLGPDAVELGYYTPWPAVDPAAYGDPEAVKRLLADLRLPAPICTLYFQNEGDREARRMRRMEYNAAVGSRVHITNGMGDTLEEMARNLRPLLKRAEQLGVYIAYENHINCPVDGIAGMEALSHRVDSDHFGFIVAAHHLAALGESVPECIHRLGKRVFSCYLWDKRKGYDPWKNEGGDPSVPEWPLAGEGQTDFREVFTALREIDFHGPVVLMWQWYRKVSFEQASAAVRKALDYVTACRDSAFTGPGRTS